MLPVLRLINIVFTFSEAVQAGSGDFKLYRSDNTLLEDLDVTSAAVTFSGSTVTVNPAADLTSHRLLHES